MRKPALSTALVLFTTSASAGPMYLESTQSVALGNFCKVYACQLVKTEVMFPETMGFKVYEYKVRGGKLTVTRFSNMAIQAGDLQTSSTNLAGQMGRDFTNSFIGLDFESAQVRQCLRKANRNGFDLFGLKVQETQYKVSCFNSSSISVYIDNVMR